MKKALIVLLLSLSMMLEPVSVIALTGTDMQEQPEETALFALEGEDIANYLSPEELEELDSEGGSPDPEMLSQEPALAVEEEPEPPEEIPPFLPGDTVYIDFDGALSGKDAVSTDNEKITLLSEDKSDGYKDFLFYMQAVKLISTDTEDPEACTAVIEDETGKQFRIPLSWLRAELPEYKADTAVKQRIIDNALTYIKGIKNTCYLFIYRDNQYSGEFSPDTAIGFNCILFVRAMIDAEVRRKVPTYDIPFPVRKFQEVLEEDRYLYNTGYKNSYRMQKVSLSKLRPADLILLDNDPEDGNKNQATHIVMYLGNGDYIHCSHGWVKNINVKNDKYTRVDKYGGVLIGKLANAMERDCIVGAARVIPDDPKPADKTIKAVKSIDLREKASTKSKLIKKIPEGKKLVIKYTDRDGDWAYVSYKGKTGYISLNKLYVPKVTAIKSIKKGKKSFTLRWSKITKNSEGYEIQYSLNSDFKKSKILRIKNNRVTGKTITHLKAKKKYYVRIRTFKTVNKIRYCSKWKKTTVKTK